MNRVHASYLHFYLERCEKDNVPAASCQFSPGPAKVSGLCFVSPVNFPVSSRHLLLALGRETRALHSWLAPERLAPERLAPEKVAADAQVAQRSDLRLLTQAQEKG